MATIEKDITYNTDVDGLVRRIHRSIVEIVKSQSSGVSQTISYDVVRMRSYVNALRTYIEYVRSQPVLDLPETGPRAVALPSKPNIPALENESAYDFAILLDLMRDEVANSQSSRMSSNLLDHDYQRMDALMQRMDRMINEYITVIDPLDLPESSPQVPVSGPGLGGV